eukprot:scaffold1583_cov105-Isochrysis_galbana.AAC.1
MWVGLRPAPRNGGAASRAWPLTIHCPASAQAHPLTRTSSPKRVDILPRQTPGALTTNAYTMRRCSRAPHSVWPQPYFAACTPCAVVVRAMCCMPCASALCMYRGEGSQLVLCVSSRA